MIGILRIWWPSWTPSWKLDFLHGQILVNFFHVLLSTPYTTINLLWQFFRVKPYMQPTRMWTRDHGQLALIMDWEIKWNESGFRPPLCTYGLNWARRTSWGWWDDWNDTVLQTQDSKFEPWRSEAEHATSRSRRLPTILTFTRGWGRSNFVSFKPPRPGTEPRTQAWKAAVLTTTLGPPPIMDWEGWRPNFALKKILQGW